FVEESARDTRCARIAAEWFVRMRPPGADEWDPDCCGVDATRSEMIPRERPMARTAPVAVARKRRISAKAFQYSLGRLADCASGFPASRASHSAFTFPVISNAGLFLYSGLSGLPDSAALISSFVGE